MEQGRRMPVIFFRFVPKVGREESTPAPFLIGYANAAVLTSLFLTVLATPLRPLSPCQLASEPADLECGGYSPTPLARR